MAQRKNDPPNPDNSEAVVFFAHLKGNNQSLQDALKTVAAAFNRAMPGSAVVTRIPGNGRSQAALPAAENVPEPEEVIDVESTGAEDAAEAAPTVRKARGTGPKKDWNEGIKVVPDLDFRPEGKPTLRDFDTEKAPKTDQERVVVIVFFMNHMMGLAQVGLGHILTAFNDIGEPVPSDLRSTVKKCKAKAWLKYATINEIELATGGANLVRHDLPRKDK
jgi:hypothetical protein